SLVGVGAVALEAVVRQDRADLAVEIDLARGGMPVGPRVEPVRAERQDESDPEPCVEPEPLTSPHSRAFLHFGQGMLRVGGRWISLVGQTSVCPVTRAAGLDRLKSVLPKKRQTRKPLRNEISWNGQDVRPTFRPIIPTSASRWQPSFFGEREDFFEG